MSEGGGGLEGVGAEGGGSSCCWLGSTSLSTMGSYSLLGDYVPGWQHLGHEVRVGPHLR